MAEIASLLFEPSEHPEARKLARLLEFFGISATRWGLDEFLARPVEGHPADSRLLCSARALLKLMEALDQMADGRQSWLNRLHSAFVYAAGDVAAVEELARRLTGDRHVSNVQVPPHATWVVTDTLPDFCKSMSGLPVSVRANADEHLLGFDESRSKAIKVVSCEAGSAVVKLEYGEVTVYLATTCSIIDIDSGLEQGTFDIRSEFLSAAPVVMYIKWAFDAICWKPAITSASLTIDDPLLRPRYGFLNFEHLLDQMGTHEFSTSIAFIPWNWRRSSRKVVRLFAKNPKRLSLSIHGCDHTKQEFGTEDAGWLAWKFNQAFARMARHESMTGIRCDPVMIFPQGIFSDRAMEVLKHAGFIGVVNSDVVSTNAKSQSVRVADYWDVAVRKYSNFPIFTRRYPSHGVENFAFDVLLGKPCLVVIHHSDCRDRCKALIEFIDRLNALNTTLSWCSLGQAVRHSFRQRDIHSDLAEIEMYGSEMCVENRSIANKRFRISRQEAEPASIREIRVGAKLVNWKVANDRVMLEIKLKPGERETVMIIFSASPSSDFRGETLRYKLHVMLRRYLSEVRDNYLSRWRLENWTAG